ncbi:SH3 domain-containing protein [Streptomyces sp. NPDC001709]
MVTKLARVATVVALVGGVVAGVVPAASAAPAKSRTLASITLRAKPTAKSTALGVIPKGTVITTNDTSYVAGATYKACGVKERLWYPVKWKGAKGYVVAACLQWV